MLEYDACQDEVFGNALGDGMVAAQCDEEVCLEEGARDAHDGAVVRRLLCFNCCQYPLARHLSKRPVSLQGILSWELQS